MLVFLIFLQNFSERQILWSLCSVVFHALTLKLPIQTSLSVALELPLSLSSHEKFQENKPTLGSATDLWCLPPCLSDFLIRTGSCFVSRNGIAKFKLAPSDTYYVVWFKASYVRDINGSGKMQVGILAIVRQFVVFTSFIIVFNDNMYT